jgi:cellobiose phosphorylase
VTRYRYNNVPTDSGGRYLYVRDNASSVFWSPTWQPTPAVALDDHACSHGPGYTRISARYADVGVDTLYFVPIQQTLEVWRTRITNRRQQPADLSLFSAVEFCLWDAADDATNFQRNLSTGEVEVADGVIYHKTEYRERRDHFAYFACSTHADGFDTSRDAFLGPYRGWDRPAVVEQGSSTGSIAHGWSPIGSHHVRLQLEPDETREIIFVLGHSENQPSEKFDPPGSQTLNKREVRRVIEQFSQLRRVEDAFVELKERWTQVIESLRVQTPDPHVDRMVDMWNAYKAW